MAEFTSLFQGLNPKGAYMSSDKDTGRFRGFGFIEVPNEGDAQRALSMSGMEYKGRKIKVEQATPGKRKDRRERE